ncbi:hypothetical protein JRQ81_010477 [Phrynocephalus forsythii]|uniref:Testis-expressed sequence 2 protein n=1 Tax=Phrynocephalus forsythii TaxID=171643 RepID=A0A9Q0X8N8_9SAUR|nr:hypothetical protein JRQ81_010477 [Phrynocephalus forsythii]
MADGSQVTSSTTKPSPWHGNRTSPKLAGFLDGSRKEEDWMGTTGNELIFPLEVEEEVETESPGGFPLCEESKREPLHPEGSASLVPSPPEPGILAPLSISNSPTFPPPRSSVFLSHPQGPQAFIHLVKPMSTEGESSEGSPVKDSPVKPQPLLSLVKSISTEISRLEPEVTLSKSDSKLNIHLWRQITQAKGKDGDSRTAPSSPNTSPSESKGGFFKAQEAKFEDTKRRFSEAMQEPLQRFSKIMGDENNVSPKPKPSMCGSHAQGSPSSRGKGPALLETKTEGFGQERDQSSRKGTTEDAPSVGPAQGPSPNGQYKICSLGDVIQVVEVPQNKGSGPEEGRALPPLDALHPPEPCHAVPCKALACVAILAYNYFVLPLPPYLSGLCLGVAGGFLLGFLAILLLVPTTRPLPPRRRPLPRDRWSSEGLVQPPREPSVLQGWMNEMYFYDPEIYHPSVTHSVFVTLEHGSLKLSYPKNNIPRRAMFEEVIMDVAFVTHRHYELKGAKVFLLPPGLARKRTWNKKYPICITFPDPVDLDGQGPSGQGEDPAGEWAPVNKRLLPSLENPLKPPAESPERTLYLFGRTGREKEEWFQHLVRASRAESGLQQNTNPGFNQLSPSRKGAYSNSSSRGSTEDLLSTIKPKDLLMNVREELFLGYDKYMSRLVPPANGSGPPESPCPNATGSPTPQKFPGDVDIAGLWVNMEVTYSGSLQMTLETKMNLYKLGKDEAEDSRKMDNVPEGVTARLVLLADSDAESSSAGSSEEEDIPPMETSGIPGERNTPTGAESHVGGNSTSRRLLRFVDKIAKSKYFQKATENEFIKKKMEEVSNTPLLLTVEVQELTGTLTVNIPPPPTDRIWYSFRVPPQLDLKVRPKLGEREVTFIHVTEWIEKKLQHEFQKILVMPHMDDLILPLMHSGLEYQLPAEDL